MPRTRRPAVPPDPPTPPPSPRPPTPPALLLDRRKTARGLIAIGVARHQLQDAMRDVGFPDYTEGQARGDYDAVLREWSADYEQDKALTRAQQLRRLNADLAVLRRDRKWSNVARHEELIARISGHFAPTRVHVDGHVTVREGILSVVAGMTPEELDALAAEQLDLELRAGLPQVVEAEGVPVPE